MLDGILIGLLAVFCYAVGHVSGWRAAARPALDPPMSDDEREMRESAGRAQVEAMNAAFDLAEGKHRCDDTGGGLGAWTR